MRKAVQIVLLFAALGCTAMQANAQADGAVIVRVADTARPRCINPSNDRVWLTLRRVIVDRAQRWLVKDASVAIILNAGVKTQGAKLVAFPLSAEATLEGFATGQVSVPVEYTVVDGLLLKQDKNVLLTGMSIEMTLLNLREMTAMGTTLQALLETAKKLPIPANPIGETANYVLDFANSAVSKALAAQDADDKAKSAAIAFNFAPDGKCEGAGAAGFETTGTKVVLQTSGVRGPGYVPTHLTNNYCWTAELQPAFVLKAAPRGNAAGCDDPAVKAQYRQVTNNYVGFFLNAVATRASLGGDEHQDETDSLQRCSQHGISGAKCF